MENEFGIKEILGMSNLTKYNLSVKGIPLLGVLGTNVSKGQGLTRDEDFSTKTEYFKYIWGVTNIKWLGAINSKGTGVYANWDVIGHPFVPYDEVKSRITAPLVGIRIGGKIYVNLGKYAYDDTFYVNKPLTHLIVRNRVTWNKITNSGSCQTTVENRMSASRGTPFDFSIELRLANTASLDGSEEGYGTEVLTKIPAGRTTGGTVISFGISKMDEDTGANTCVIRSCSYDSLGNNKFTYRADGSYLGGDSASWTTKTTSNVEVDIAQTKIVTYTTEYTIDPMTLA